MKTITEDNTDDWSFSEDGESIVGVLSAPSMTFEMYGVDDNEKTYPLGTTVTLTKGTRDRFKTYGVKGETYDEILVRLMDEHDERANK